MEVVRLMRILGDMAIPSHPAPKRARVRLAAAPAALQQLQQLQQSVLLQLFAQGIAIDAQHLRRVRLVAFRAQHHDFKDRLFDGEHHHVVDVRCLLFAQVIEIFFKTFLDNFLDTFFAHFFLLHPAN
jgi:hypothetical protein